MALIGYENERSRIDAIMSQIRAELGHTSTRTSVASPIASAEPKTTGRKRFSAAAKKNMRIAQKARWKAVKLAKAEASKPKRKPTAKRPVPVKASKKVVPKPTAKKVAQKVPKVAAKPGVSKPVPAVEPAEAASAEITA